MENMNDGKEAYNTIGHEIYLVEADRPKQAIEKVLTDKLAYK